MPYLAPFHCCHMSAPRTFVFSPLARIARLVLGTRRVAMVIGDTVHLSGASRREFLADPEWVAHELVHIRQFRENGFLPFLAKYLIESARVGYYQNKYEVEAREEARCVVTQQGGAPDPLSPNNRPPR